MVIIVDGREGTFSDGEEYTMEIFSDGVYLRATQTAYTTADGRTHTVDRANQMCIRDRAGGTGRICHRHIGVYRENIQSVFQRTDHKDRAQQCRRHSRGGR